MTSCAGCGGPAHRYSTADPYHEYDAMGCVNYLRSENERLRAAQLPLDRLLVAWFRVARRVRGLRGQKK